ncbi:hypothetical protein EUTSA_v10011024mg, partial [Eutrema salsugineum]
EQPERFDLFLVVGGYWSKEDGYVGGEPHQIGREVVQGFSMKTVKILLQELGYKDNMKKMAWFAPEAPAEKIDIIDDEGLRRAVSYAIASGALTLFIVREDDPDLVSRGGRDLGIFSDDEVEDNNDNISGNGSSSDESDSSSNEEDDGNVAEDGNGNGNSGMYQYGTVFSSDNQPRVERGDETKCKKFELGQEFASLQSFKSVILNYAVKKKYDISFFKSDNQRVVAVCSDRACPWMISCSINRRVSILTNARIAELFIDEFRKNINVPWTICERTRLRCLQTFDDEQAESLARLHDYVGEIKRTNPGSTVEVEVSGGVFQKNYVCFKALKDGWKKTCQRMIHIDGTFLKWRQTGQLLVACGRDPNDQMFPFAWGIVDAETTDNWKWFFQHLIDDLELESSNCLTLMSDQCKGLIGAVKEVLPYAVHKLCARHVYHNWKKNYSGAEFEDLFWGAADAYYIASFKRKMEAVKLLYVDAYEALKMNAKGFCRSGFFDEYSRVAAVENNLGESFNAAIRIARTKPVVEMLEEIIRRVMVSNEQKRKEAFNGRGIYTPRVKALLDQQIELAKNCTPLHCGLGKYEVGYFNDMMYIVSGIPCCHIVSALCFEKNVDQDPKKLISDWFTMEKLRACYETPMEPVNGMNLWEIVSTERVMPPAYKRPPDRPPGSKKRKREKGEPREKGKMSKVGMKMHCRNCGQEGHKINKCNNPTVIRQKKPPGRPRKNPTETGTSSQQTIHETTSSQPILTSVRALIRAQTGAPHSLSQPTPSEGVTSEAWKTLKNLSQPTVTEGPTSLSSAFPRAKPGRPRKNQYHDVGSSQQVPTRPPREEPVYDPGPIQIPRVSF